eukprot:5924662-Amphidinium_carterae.1
MLNVLKISPETCTAFAKNLPDALLLGPPKTKNAEVLNFVLQGLLALRDLASFKILNQGSPLDEEVANQSTL